MIHLTPENFSKYIQKIMENFYLQPMDGTKKQNVKNGYIERSIHGAMHASRATLWALIMQNLLEQITPQYTASALNRISKFLNTDPDTVKLLILISMACHDAGRKGEGIDYWEKESSDIAAQILRDIGLEENQIKLFSKAIQFKDQEAEYKKELEKLGIAEHDMNEFDYIRKLINLGDNLDLVRCVNPFKTEFIFNTLDEIDDFNEGMHTEIVLNLIKEINQFVYEQHDLRFGCKIMDKQNNIISDLPSRLANKEKVKYEHAENVFAVMVTEALQNPLFKTYLNNIKIQIPKSKKFSEPCKFDPFIHGTNTSIFSTLLKSEFQIMSPLEMIDKYQTAPMTGELTKGGYDILGFTNIKDERIGKTSFAKITPFDNHSYSLDEVLSNYITMQPASAYGSLHDFKNALSLSFEEAFNHINLLLIYFARARQTHSLEEVISKEELIDLEKQLNGTIQFYYFIQLLGNYIYPNYEEIHHSGMEETIKDGAYSLLTFKNIVNKIIEHNINMEEIVNNPTEENLEKALKVLEFPKKCTINTGPTWQLTEVEFPITQFFCLDGNNLVISGNLAYEPNASFILMAKNTIKGYKINDFLEKYIAKYVDTIFFIDFGECAKKHLIALKDRIRLFYKLLKTPQDKFYLSDIQKYFLKQPFPIILLAENEDKITLYDSLTHEYRSLEPLKIGRDIKMVATDTANHRLEIMKFFDLHGMTGIQVILFDDLKVGKISKEKPSEPYHHDDGIPTLKWLAAKEVSVQLHSIFKTSHQNNSKICTEKNIKTANDLIEDAKKYNEIEFAKYSQSG